MARSQERRFIKTELLQRLEEGCDVDEISDRIHAAIERDADDDEFLALYDELVDLPISETCDFVEPSTLEEIRGLRPDAPRKLGTDLDDDVLHDRIYGGWLGRSAGCVLGKPIEGWPKENIEKHLSKTGALPLDDYVPFDEKTLPRNLKASTRGNIQYMDRDDDLDYPILGLLALEQKGAGMTSKSMAYTWLGNFPFEMACTAEHAAYRNFVNAIWPPDRSLADAKSMDADGDKPVKARSADLTSAPPVRGSWKQFGADGGSIFPKAVSSFPMTQVGLSN
jgi:hypothetical protein